MMRVLVILFFAFSTLGSFAQDAKDPILLTIDDKKVSKSEFETIFRKNNRDSAITKADLDEYVELFINFKLKVTEAEELGMDTVLQFQRELDGYRDQLAKPYLVDKSMTDSLIREAYNRMMQEVRASHILIKLPADPNPEDTAKAYATIMKLKAELEADPVKFEQVARNQSEDPSAKSNGGDLGYFGALQMVYPFENAVYNTELGKIGGPVRTQYGYHLIKVTDKRKALGEVRVAHIMIRAEEGDPADVQLSLRQRADEVYERLKNGEDFADLAKRFSDDRSSAGRGGELPAFGTGKMVAEFEEAAFAIDEVGSYTKPVKSPYGWHIIKLIERIPLKSYEEMEKDLRTRISKDSRSNMTKDSFIAKRKKEYNFSEDLKQLKPYYKEVDTTYFSGSWVPSPKLESLNKTLFVLDGQEYTTAGFTQFLKERMRPRRKVMDVKTMIDETYRTFVDQTVMNYEDERLEEKYPDFRALVNEYRDGILLFDLTDQKVWSKAVKDSAGLAEFYKANINDFMWDERAGYDIYTIEDEKTGKEVIKMLKKGKNQDDIRKSLNSESALSVRVESGLKEKSELPVLGKVAWEPGISEIVNDEGQLKVVHIKEIRKPEPKAFEEARGLITAAYQNYLEKEWIDTLRNKHKVEVNKEVLYSIE